MAKNRILWLYDIWFYITHNVMTSRNCFTLISYSSGRAIGIGRMPYIICCFNHILVDHTMSKKNYLSFPLYLFSQSICFRVQNKFWHGSPNKESIKKCSVLLASMPLGQLPTYTQQKKKKRNQSKKAIFFCKWHIL